MGARWEHVELGTCSFDATSPALSMISQASPPHPLRNISLGHVNFISDLYLAIAEGSPEGTSIILQKGCVWDVERGKWWAACPGPISISSYLTVPIYTYVHNISWSYIYLITSQFVIL